VQATVATADQPCWGIAALEKVATRIEDLWPSQEKVAARQVVVTYVTPRSSINVPGLRGHVSCARRARGRVVGLDLILLHAPYVTGFRQEVILQGPLADAMALGGRTMDPAGGGVVGAARRCTDDGPLRTDKR
jgi:hypothetical protein